MVSLLIVSHSAQLAAGVKEFAEQVAGGKVQIADAGGAADGSLGTSVDRIQERLRQVASPDGTLVLVDLEELRRRFSRLKPGNWTPARASSQSWRRSTRLVRASL
jgi:hypothetical protein